MKTVNTQRLCIINLLFVASSFLGISWADGSGAAISLKNNFKDIGTKNTDIKIHRHPLTGATRFIAVKNKKPLVIKKGKALADSIAETYAPAFGLANPSQTLKLKTQHTHTDAITTYRYQQHHKGIPVIAAELVAAVDARQQLNYISGETVLDLSLSTQPKIMSDEASRIALAAVSKWYYKQSDKLTASAPQLSIYKPDVISPNTMPAYLVWKINVTSEKINELVFIHAQTGAVAFHLNQVHSALNRRTYSANNTATYQAQLICDESDPNCDAGDADAKLAHQYAADTYNFYFDNHARDGIDGSGGAIISSVHVGPDFQNAAWTGSQIIYGNGFPQADDVVAHELTHGVTEKTSNLFYYYQSGAISESFSDIWGEFVDQTNTGGTDNGSVKWLIGEDIPGLGAIRNMKTPTAFSEPDKMSSSFYFTGSADNGGVHFNSGINNKAVYLLTDGGSFNGQTISALGMTKVAKLYYEVQTKHLTSGSDYLDLYNALIQACSDLAALTNSDCTQVQKALLAVEMNQQPAKGFSPEASLCPAAATVGSTFFSDDLESGLSNWSFTHNTSLFNNDWLEWLSKFPTSPYATSGTGSLFAENVAVRSDQYAQISVSLPATTDKVFLHFKHSVDLEAVETITKNEYFDAAVLEYSTDSGVSWNDAIDLIVDGKNYTGVIDNNFSNPLAGRLAFSAISNGFVSTRVNLSSFAGSNLLLRWRVATDNSIAATGWVVDDVSIVTCVASTGSLPVARAGSDQSVNSGTAVNLNASASSDADAAIASYNWEQIGGKVTSLSNSATATPSFTATSGGGVLAFKLTVTDSDGLTDTDIVNVIVNTAPTAQAGNDFEAIEATMATLDASLSLDTDGSVVSYRWTQVAGEIVTLNNANSAVASFTVPTFASQILRFSLVVTDNDGNISSADTVDVTVKPVPVVASSGGGGGCSLNSNAAFNPFMFILLLGLSVIHLWRGSRKRNKSLL